MESKNKLLVLSNVSQSVWSRYKIINLQVATIEKYLTDYSVDLENLNNEVVIKGLIDLLDNSTFVIYEDLKYKPLISNMEFGESNNGLSCINNINSTVACNPRENLQSWIMDINGLVRNGNDLNKCLVVSNISNAVVTIADCTSSEDSISGNKFILEAVNGKKYLKDTKFNFYIELRNNQLHTSLILIANSNVANLNKLNDILWDKLSIEDIVLILKVINHYQKTLPAGVTVINIEKLETKLSENYPDDRVYPLLVSSEVNLVTSMNNAEKTYLFKKRALKMIENYYEADIKAVEVTNYIKNNKAQLENRDTQIVNELLKIASTSKFGLDISKPVFTTWRINNDNCMSNKYDDTFPILILENNQCNTDDEKFAIDQSGHIRSLSLDKYNGYKDWCFTQYDLEGNFGNVNLITCAFGSTEEKQIFMYESIENKPETYNIKTKFMNTYLTGNAQSGPHRLVGYNYKTNNINQEITNIAINYSMIWLIPAIERKLLIDIVQEKY